MPRAGLELDCDAVRHLECRQLVGARPLLHAAAGSSHDDVPGCCRREAAEALRHAGVVGDAREGEAAAGQAHDVKARRACAERQLRVCGVKRLAILGRLNDLSL